jgi:arylsulfatase A-like enzyme
MYRSILFTSRALALFCLLFTIIHSNAQQPNIIYIMSDDMGYGDLSCYGQKSYTTPNLDKLAAQGIKFTNAYSSAPLCTPSRTAFMTGRYPAHTQVGLIEPLTGQPVDTGFGLQEPTNSLAALMRSGGYHTALIGKWHLGALDKHSPTRNGFDYFFGIRSGAADYISHKGTTRKPDLYENETPVNRPGYLTDLFTETTLSFLKKKHTKPFFLALTFNAPHWPWQAPGDRPYHDTANYRSGGSPATFAAMMARLDEAVGKILKMLDDEQLTKSTIVIFTNDNGGERFSNHGGLSKEKGSLWEGGIRVPAFVRWPGHITPGSTTAQVAVTMDWTSTILSMAKLSVKPAKQMDGIDLVPVLTGKTGTIERTIYWRTFQRLKQKAMRAGNWKYLQDEKCEYLFNVATDQAEKNDLKATQPAVFAQLKQQYAAWETTVLRPIPL